MYMNYAMHLPATPRQPPSVWRTSVQGNARAAITSLGYLALGGIWIATSDRLGAMLFASADQLTLFQSLKGMGFVVATAMLIFAVMRRAAPASRVSIRANADLPHRRAWPMSVLLLALVLATGLPMIGLMVYGLQREAQRDVEQAHRLIASLTDVSSVDTQAFLAEQGRVAAMLALRPLLRQLVSGQCDPVLSDIMAARPELSNIVSSRLDGVAVCSAIALTHEDGASPPWWRKALDEGAGVAIGDPKKDPRSGAWQVPLVYPIRGPAGLQGSLRLDVFLSAFHPMVTAALPEGGIAAIINSQGYVIARSLEPQNTVGQRLLDPAVVDFIVRTRSGQSPAPASGKDAVERQFAFRPVGDTGWFAITGLPTGVMYSQARANALRMGLAALMVLALSAGLVVLVSQRITAPMRALTRTARRVAHGQFDLRAPEGGPREVAEVSAGFNRMLDRIPLIEQQLRESEERYRALVELAPDGVVMIEGGRLTYVNPGFRALFGLPLNAPVSAISLAELAAPEDRDALSARLAQLQGAPGGSPAVQLTMRRQDGTLIQVEQASISVRMKGRVVVQSHLRDVTARHMARQALEAANETLESRIQERTGELQDANHALEAFSYSVAHDLRAPVACVGGFADALASSVARGDTAKAAHYASRILHNTKKMNAMIDGLLKLARAGRMRLDCRPVDMNVMVQQVLADHDGASKALCHIEDLPVVMADADTIRQVWCNLISNALKYSSHATTPTLDIRSRVHAGEYVFTVADNGMGFDSVAAENLFGVFQRLPGAEAFEGTGVGLAIVRRIVERHGGRVWADGKPGEGARFSFALPCAGR